MTAGRRRVKWRCLGGTGTSLKRGVAVLQAFTKAESHPLPQFDD